MRFHALLASGHDDNENTGFVSRWCGSGQQVPIACQALAHESREIRLVGLRLANLVSTTSGSRQTAMRYGLLERIKVSDFDNDEGEDENKLDAEQHQIPPCNVDGIRVRKQINKAK